MARPEVPQPASSLATRRYGYDIFLSFALGNPPRGTQAYASDLARRMRERDFTVFFSEDVMPPGGELGPALSAALTASRSLVFIANRETLRDPRWLKTEIEAFRQLKGDRPIIIINVGGALQDSELGPQALSWLDWQNRIWVDESTEALEAGVAAASTLERLVLAPLSAQSNYRWRRLTRGVIAGLLVLVVALGLVALIAMERDSRARAALQRSVALKLAAEGQAILNGSQPGGDEQGLQKLVAAARLDPGHPSILGSLNQALLDRRSLLKLAMTEDQLTTVAVSPDGRLIATGDFAGRIHLWVSGNITPRAQAIQAHKSRVSSLAFSPDGQTLASAGDEGLKLWSSADGRPLKPALSYTKQVWSVTFSRDGKLLASGDEEGHIRLWNADTHAPIGQPLRHGAAVWSLAFGADGMLASGGADETIRLWSVRNTKAPVRILRGHIQDVWSLAFSADGRTLVSGGDDWTVRFWDVATGLPHSDTPIVLHTDKVWAVSFHPSDAQAVSASLDGTLRLWDANTGTSPTQPLRGHSDGIRGVSYSADGQQIVSVSHDHSLRLWTLASRPALRSDLPEPVKRGIETSFFYGNQRFEAMQDGSALRIWHAAQGKHVDLPLQGPPDPVRVTVFSADGRLVVAGGKSGRLRRWDTVSGTNLGSPIQAHQGEITALALSADGRVLASGGEDQMLSLWDARTGQPQELVIPRQEKSIRVLALSPNGRLVAFSNGDRFLHLWDVQTRVPLNNPPLPSHEDTISQLAFSPDGRLLASGGEDLALHLWDTLTGLPQPSPLKVHEDNISSLAFSPDGRTLASGGGDGRLQLWDSTTGAPIGPPIERHQSHILGLAFSPDGKTLTGHGERTSEWLAPQSWPDALCHKLSRNASLKEWRNWAGTEIDYVEAPACQLRQMTKLELLTAASNATESKRVILFGADPHHTMDQSHPAVGLRKANLVHGGDSLDILGVMPMFGTYSKFS